MPMTSNKQVARAATLALAAAAAMGVAYAIFHAEDHRRAAAPPAPPVPVAIARALQQDVPVYLVGIGTVEPYNTVTIRSRVDGELQQVLYKEGQDIARGAVIAVIDPRTYEAALEQAKAKLAQDEAARANAQLIYERDARLGKDAFASQQAVDTEQSTVAQLEAQIAQDRAAIDSAQTELSYTRITSPIDGRAGIRLVDQGNIVHASDTTGLVVINQIHPISVISTLPQRDVAVIRDALGRGPVEAQAVSRDDGTVLDVGAVEIIDNKIDPQSGTLRVKSNFPNEHDQLWPGLFVDLRMRVATLPAAITVPSGAIQRGPDGPYVYTVGAGNAVAVTPVETGQIADNVAVVTRGLAEGQTVVTEGQYRLAPGTIVVPDASPPGTPPAKPAAANPAPANPATVTPDAGG